MDKTLSQQLELMVKVYQSGESLKSTARATSLHPSLVWRHLKFRNLLRKQGVPTEVSTEWQPGDPTPEEISERCAEIQAGWTPEECSRRWVGRSGLRRVPASHRVGRCA